MLERHADRRDGRAHWKLVAAAVAVAAVIGLLAIAGGGGHPTSIPPAPMRGGASVVSGHRPMPPTAATVAVRRFLTGYLPFLYGQVGAEQLHAVTPQLRRSVAAQRGRVTPAERTRHPRVIALAFAPGDLRRSVLFEAQIDDGASRYRVRLRVARHGAVWRVVELPDVASALGPSGADWWRPIARGSPPWRWCWSGWSLCPG